jgi:Secretory lipase
MLHSRRLHPALAAALALFLAACGGGDDDNGAGVPDRGALFKSPPAQLATLTAEEFTASLQASASGAQLLQIAGAPACGIDVRYVQYGTVGAKGERASATGAMFVPTGTSATCSGERPILLYAHGTTSAKDYNIALLGSTNAAAGEAGLVAAMYAAQGYIVVAPNYAGYESSSLGYHPYLVADQQSKDMIDALHAGRSALPAMANGTTDNGKLFIAGYSQGGHVAMATHRALQEAGETVTASAGGSGPYALATLIDATFGGTPNLGGTVFTPLITSSWQQAYGDIYAQPTDIYTSTYATGIDTLLPSVTPLADLFTTGKLPQLTLFGNDVANYPAVAPQFQVYYGAPDQSLINTTYANAMLGDLVANPCPYTDAAAPLNCSPANTLRKAAQTNDLRNWTPSSPLLMCGGNADPTVFFVSSQLTQAYFQAKLVGPAQALSTLVDVDSSPTSASDPFAQAKGGFAQAKAATGAAAAAAVAAAGGDAAAQAIASARAIVQAYHGSLVPPFCNAVARGFFSQF